MSASKRPRVPLRWSMNEDLHAWFIHLAQRLDLTKSVLIRMFVLQLKEGEPETCQRVEQFVDLGLHDALVCPATCKVFLDEELHGWLGAFVNELQHPASAKRKVQLRHLVAGYILYLRTHERDCVKYGAIRIPREATPRKRQRIASHAEPQPVAVS